MKSQMGPRMMLVIVLLLLLLLAIAIYYVVGNELIRRIVYGG